MTTKTSFFNFGRMVAYYKNTLKRNLGLGIFFAALTAFFLPVQYAMTISRSYFSINDFMGVAPIYNEISLIFMILEMGIPIVFAVNIFSYMQSKQAVDVFHSLPITREEMFAGNILSGITLIATSLIFNFGAIVIMSGFEFGMGTYFLPIMGELFCWIAYTFAVFSITAFAMINAGTVFDGVIYTGALLGGLSALYITVLFIFNAFVFGFADPSLPIEHTLKLSPITVIIERLGYGISGNSYSMQNKISSNFSIILMWLVIGAALAVVSAMFYKKRKSEYAQSTAATGLIPILVRAEATFIGGALLGAFFAAVTNDSSLTNFALYSVVSGFIAFCVFELILTRNVIRVFKKLPIACICGIATGSVIFLLGNGMFAYEKALPTIDQVKSIRIDYLGFHSDNPMLRGMGSDYITLSDPESISIVLDIHKKQIEKKDLYKKEYLSSSISNNNNFLSSNGINIEYELNNGKKIYRRYNMISSDNLNNLLLLETNEAILKQVAGAFHVNADNLVGISISMPGFITANMDRLIDGYEVSKQYRMGLIEAIQKDILAQTPEQLNKARKLLLKIDVMAITPNEQENYERFETTISYKDISSNTTGFNVYITPEFTNTLEYLKTIPDFTLDNMGIIDFRNEDVDSVYISANGYGYGYRSIIKTIEFPGYNLFETGERDSGVITVDNPKEFINETNEKFGSLLPYGTDIQIGIKLKDDRIYVYNMKFDDLPQKYKDQLLVTNPYLAN